MKYNSKIIIACDFVSKKELFEFLSLFKNEKLFLKLGMQILYSEGFSIINELKKLGHNIFIDLKLFDIPNTIKQAVKSLLKYEPDFITIHSFSGKQSLQIAQSLVENTNTKILGITLLTSMSQDDMYDFQINVSIKNYFKSLLNLISTSNIAGVICSPHEASQAKNKNLIAVTPGIRLDNDIKDDQKRTMNPKDAFANGADFLVIGRSITKNKDPYKIYLKIIEDIK